MSAVMSGGRELVGAVRFELTTTGTPCRYATRLRYAPRGRILPLQLVEDGAQLALDRGHIDAGGVRQAPFARRRRLGFLFRLHARGVQPGAIEPRGVQTITRPADGEALFVQQLADAPDQQHLVMLVIAPVAAPLDRLELGEFLLPVAQHVRLHPAKLAHLTDGEVALRRDRRQLSFLAAL